MAGCPHNQSETEGRLLADNGGSLFCSELQLFSLTPQTRKPTFNLCGAMVRRRPRAVLKRLLMDSVRMLRSTLGTCGCSRHTAAGGTASRERLVIGWGRTFPARLATSGTGQKPSLKLALFLFLIPSAAAIQALVYFPKCAAG